MWSEHAPRAALKAFARGPIGWWETAAKSRKHGEVHDLSGSVCNPRRAWSAVDAHRWDCARAARIGAGRLVQRCAGARDPTGFAADYAVCGHRCWGRGDPPYAVGGVRGRTTVAAAAARLTLGAGITVGKNTWYLIRTNKAVWVLKAQHGIIREIGITTRSLTSTPQARRTLVRNL
jgi:hypothetical protein